MCIRDSEQIQFIKKKIAKTSDQNIIVISDDYHLVRVLEIARFHKTKILVSASALSQSFEKAVYNKMREALAPVSYTHLRAHETVLDLVCRLLLEKKKTLR